MRTWNDVKVWCNESDCFSIIDLTKSSNYLFSLRENFIGMLRDGFSWCLLHGLRLAVLLKKNKFLLDYHIATGNHSGFLESIFLSVCLTVRVCVCVCGTFHQCKLWWKIFVDRLFFFSLTTKLKLNKKLPQETKTRMKVITLGLIMKSFFRAPACISEIIIKYVIFSWDRHIISCPVLLFAAPHLVSFLLQNWTWTWESRYRLS